MIAARRAKGSMCYHAGLAAEDQVVRHYMRRGCRIAATRWRGQGGEVDLVVEDQGTLVFVEVKKSRSFGQAAGYLRPRQLRRIMRTSQEYLATQPDGLLTEMRIDLALVDATGAIEVIENVSMS